MWQHVPSLLALTSRAWARPRTTQKPSWSQCPRTPTGARSTPSPGCAPGNSTPLRRAVLGGCREPGSQSHVAFSPGSAHLARGLDGSLPLWPWGLRLKGDFCGFFTLEDVFPSHRDMSEDKPGDPSRDLKPLCFPRPRPGPPASGD